MLMLADCSNCHTPLELPPGATSIRCAVCKAITGIADPPPLPPPYLPSSSYHNVNYNYYHPLPPPPVQYGRKKAVTIGISYRNTDRKVGGVADAHSMKHLLINRFNFPESSILMLTEEATDPYKIPTKHNIMWAMLWLVQGCEPGDSLVFYFSGHGSQQEYYTGEEKDGHDETLCPLDNKTHGNIVDDEINATLVRPLPAGVKLHAIIDACRSGTVLDLPFLWRSCAWEDHRPPSGTWKGTNGGEAICFSGCDDDQTSIDTDALSSKGTTRGIMTSAFIQAIEKGQGTTYGSILQAMRSTINNVIDKMVADGDVSVGKPRQEPQLSSNHQFDVYAKPFSL